MFQFCYTTLLFTITITIRLTDGYFIGSNYEFECGPYGFTCERNNRVRLCDETKPLGPSFICPVGTFCNEESTNICEDAINHIDPALTKRLRCRHNERIANPNVPGCKGYILCIPNGSRFQGINLKCSGNTIFNGITRTCTSPTKYKCPLENNTKTEPELFNNAVRRTPSNGADKSNASSYDLVVGHRVSSLECKNYKFRLTQDDSLIKATYFCPPVPARGQDSVRCTIFSNNFCITLEKEETDQYVVDRTPFRRPRM